MLLVTGCTEEKRDADMGEENHISYLEEQESMKTPIESEEKSEQSSSETETSETSQTDVNDKEAEDALKKFREEREKTTNMPLVNSNGATGYGAPNEEEFGISADDSGYTTRFDAGELNEAYETAKKYVEETLCIEKETQSSVYPCVDPEITQIYSEEDKGVANGYTPDNIFVCEYCHEGIWNYLILVREAKGEPWNVIHSGSSYKE